MLKRKREIGEKIGRERERERERERTIPLKDSTNRGKINLVSPPRASDTQPSHLRPSDADAETPKPLEREAEGESRQITHNLLFPA